MLFNSLEFGVFLTIVFILYWFVTNKSLKTQNILLLAASYIFYGWWDWRFLFLLALLSAANYFIGIGIDITKSSKKRNTLFIAGLTVNIGVLGVFKYFNFFIDSFIDLVSLIGYDLPRSTTNVILPVGISFYVFLSLSYIIDVYKKNLAANRHISEVLLTLSFFPIILAGPIQRPASLLPQISQNRIFSYDQTVDGLRQILWGLFAKVVIADKLAKYVGDIFSNFPGHSGSTLALGAVFFTIQIYADFSGYSNIAIGTAKLLGFRLMQNFAYPYFSRDITEFWKRWHISLTSWFRDYVFLPFSFTISRYAKGEKTLSIKSDYFIYLLASIVTWFLTGLWHGANYTFTIWGMINGLLLIFYHLQRKPRKRLLKKLRINNNHFFLVVVETFVTLAMIVATWVIFRANSVTEAFSYFAGIFSKSLFTIPSILPTYTIFLVIVFFVTEWISRKAEYGISFIKSLNSSVVRYAICYAIIVVIFWFGGEEQTFIYFQF